MISTDYLRLLADERERQVTEHVRVRNLIRPHRPQPKPPRERHADGARRP